MASRLHMRSFILWSARIFLFFTLMKPSATAPHAVPSFFSKAYPALFVFGDSLSDPGNQAIVANSSSYMTLNYPYGETFPGRPFGRYSDGHTFVDFLALYLGLPLLRPYLDSKANFEAGVNYAVSAATALNASFLHSSFGLSPETNLSLDAQLDFHLAYKASVESSNGSLPGSPTPTAFIEGLYVIEMGGSDYMYTFEVKYSPSFAISTLLPLVIQKIVKIVENLLNNGAKSFLFAPPGSFGCTPRFLSLYDGVKDNDGCLEEYNLLYYLHGEYLYEEVSNLRVLHPNASFSFVDLYGAYKHLFQAREIFGFINGYDACCGAGQDYPNNFNLYEICNITSVSICANPNVYVSWDGIHPIDSFTFQLFNQTFMIGSYLDSPYSLV